MIEDLMRKAAWPGGGTPNLPVFAGKPPPAMPSAISLHDNDVVSVSLSGRPPEPISCHYLAALLRDGKTEGLVHVGEPDGEVVAASFAQLRAYIYGPPKHGAELVSPSAEHS